MVSSVTVLTALCVYMAILFLMALWAAKRSSAGRSVVNNPVIYSLGLTVLYTSWTFYGSVGRAANIGMMFFALYLGTMMPLFFWWTIVRKMVRIKDTYRITSIADFISARYNKSSSLAALVTIFSLVGVMPYIALQLKAIISTFAIISVPAGSGMAGLVNDNSGILITCLMILFTIAFGVRRLDPTERHPGMVMAVAVEGVFKLVAFLLIGLFVAYYLFDGLGDIFRRLEEMPGSARLDITRNDPTTFSVWASYLVIGMFAVMFLPRQFHMTVIENSQEDHIKTAMWLLPLYMFLITLLCFPVAVGGLLVGLPAAEADTFVLRLPFKYGSTWLSLTVFLGGFAASSGMIMICAMTMSTMLTNHILLPLIEWIGPLSFLRRYLLQCRWAAVAFAILIGYFFEQTVGGSYMLVSMGVISFAAASQFGPVILGGLFWRHGNKTGALIGLSLGFTVWWYTMILPALAKSGWVSDAIIVNGPWSIGFLRPEQLFGIESISPITNTVLWSLSFNVIGYVVGSALSETSEDERRLADDFVDALAPRPRMIHSGRQDSSISLVEKTENFRRLLTQYFSAERTQKTLDACLGRLGIQDKKRISIVEFAELHSQVERSLAGAVGAAAAKRAITRTGVFTTAEAEHLSAEYAAILASLRIPPEELQRRIDYYQEREMLLSCHATDLEEKIREREEEIRQRQLAEERLRKAEEKYRSIFENAVEGIFQTTPDGRFLSVNMAMARMLGYQSPERLIAEVTDIRSQLYVEPEDREEFLHITVMEEKVSGYEAQFRRRDGSRMWSSIYARPVHDKHGKLLYVEGTFEDITERKRAEDALLESEERYRSLMQAAPDPIIVYDSEGTVTYLNSAFTEVFGWTLEERLGKRLDDFVPEEETSETREAIDRITLEGRTVSLETQRRTKNGRILDVQASGALFKDREGKAAGMIVIHRDVTDKKLMEKALKESEEQYRKLYEETERTSLLYRTLLDASPDPIVVYDIEGVPLYLNPSFTRLFGWTLEDVAGKTIDFVPPECWPETILHIEKVLRGEHFANFETKRRTKDGRLIDVSVSGATFFGTDGKASGSVIQLRDITDRKKAEEQRVRLEEQLRQSQKIEAIGLLAGGIAHDFNNLLTAMLGYTNLLMKQLPEGSLQQERLSQIHSAAERAASLTQQLLAFSRKQVLDVRVIDLNEVIVNMEGMLRRLIGERINLSFTFGSSAAGIKADVGQIEQILMNLVVNARDAMPNGGKLSIETATEDLDEEYGRVGTEVKPGPYVVLAVSDTGQGMDAHTRDRVFDPFFTTKAKDVGTGLGLSTVYGIAKQHEGHITLYSEPGRGSAFKVYFPLAGDDPELIDRTVSAPEKLQGVETVLVVEDEQVVRQLVCDVLDMLGYTTLVAADAEEALRISEEHEGAIHLLLTDVVLPKMDGRSLYEQLSKDRPNMLVLYVSGYTQDAIVHHGVLDRGVQFLQKPFNVDKLAVKVREVLGELG